MGALSTGKTRSHACGVDPLPSCRPGCQPGARSGPGCGSGELEPRASAGDPNRDATCIGTGRAPCSRSIPLGGALRDLGCGLAASPFLRELAPCPASSPSRLGRSPGVVTGRVEGCRGGEGFGGAAGVLPGGRLPCSESLASCGVRAGTRSGPGLSGLGWGQADPHGSPPGPFCARRAAV